LNVKLVSQFRNIPSTCISDALGGLNNLEPAIKPLTEYHKIVGRAFTVKVRATDNLMILKGIREANPGDVLVVDAKGFSYNASCGAFVVGLAKTLGLAGMVIDGVVRDAQAIKEMDFPVFCKGVTVACSLKYGDGEVNVPVSCGDAVIKPRDIIVGDLDGVVSIPHEIESRILQNALEKLSRDHERDKSFLKDKKSALEYIDSLLSQKEL
jgi:4-hydroxy-4-methyl-2-oxoglutarate aldolase